LPEKERKIPMSLWLASLLVLVGAIALGIAVAGKNFGVADADAISSFDRPSSGWSGKLVFALVGIAFLSIGFYEFFRI